MNEIKVVWITRNVPILEINNRCVLFGLEYDFVEEEVVLLQISKK